MNHGFLSRLGVAQRLRARDEQRTAGGAHGACCEADKAEEPVGGCGHKHGHDATFAEDYAAAQAVFHEHHGHSHSHDHSHEHVHDEHCGHKH